MVQYNRTDLPTSSSPDIDKIIEGLTQQAAQIERERAQLEAQQTKLAEASAKLNKSRSSSPYSSDNPFSFRAHTGGIVRTVGLYGQSATRAVQGMAKLLGFGSLGLLAATQTSLISAGTATSALTALPLIGAGAEAGTLAIAGATTGFMAAVPPVALLAGLMVGAVVLNKMFNAADRKLSGVTGAPVKNDGLLSAFNPLAGIGNTLQTVGISGKAVGNTLKSKGNLAILAGTGLALAELGGAYFATTAAGAAITGFTGSAAATVAGVVGLGAAPALAIFGGIIVAGFLASKIGKGLDGAIDSMLHSGKARGAPTPA